MKRHIAVLLVLGLVLGLLGSLSGCRKERKTDANTTRLVIWQGFKFEEVTVMEEMAERFKSDWLKKNPGKKMEIIIERVSYDDMVTKIKTAALAKITPDVAFVDAIKVTDLAYGQTLVKFDELEGFKKRYGTIADARKEFVGASFDMATVNVLGKTSQFGLPVQTTTLGLFYNRSMFRKKAEALRQAGLDPNRPPKDWDELIQYARILEDPANKVYGYAMSGSLWFNFPIFNQYGVEWVTFEENGKAVANVDNERGKAALSRIAGLYLDQKVEAGAWKRGAMGPDQGFINEKYAMILMGPWNVEKFSQAGLDFDVGLVPAVPEKEAARLGIPAESSSNIGGQTGVIFRTCPDHELAYDFIEFFTAEAQQREWAERLGQIPVRLAAWEGLNTEKYPFIPKFMEQLKFSKRIPQIPLYSTLESDIANPELDLVLSGKKDVDSALEDIEKSLEARILTKMNSRVE